MLCFVFAALIVVLDQFFKRWIVMTIEIHGQVDLIPGVICLTHVQNTGAAFSLLSDQRWLLAGISFVVAIILCFILLRYTEGFWGTLGLAAVLGGAVGNLIDRVFYGYVVDMFRPLFIDFAIFNIADIFITLGFLTFSLNFIISSINSSRRGLPQPEAAPEEQAEDPYSIYDVPDRQELPDFDSFTAPVATTSKVDVPQPEVQQENYVPVLEAQDDYEAEPQLPEDISSALDALEALESDLGEIEDLDVDALLRGYGFEETI